MIKLVRPDKPVQLTPEKEQELLKHYTENGSSVWRKNYIIDALRKMSHGKCCYCETSLTSQAKNIHVEHFHCKSKYPDEVVKWDNLLPACSQCNSNKGTLDTYKDSIIRPDIDEPRDYLYMKNFMIKSKDNSLYCKGRRTVEIFELNNRERLLNPRLEIASAVDEQLADLYKIAADIGNHIQIKQREKNKLVNGIKKILKMAQVDSEYSAVMSTIILSSEDYSEIKDILMNKQFWDDELKRLDEGAGKLKLDTRR